VAAVGLQIADRADAQGHVTLKLTGELDTESVPAFEAVLERQFGAGASGLTLDLSELVFIDSTGLAAIVLASRLCERDGCALEIVPGPRAVQRLFEVTGLVDVLPFSDAPDPRP
jgi:anti-sigma B factor antagonist